MVVASARPRTELTSRFLIRASYDSNEVNLGQLDTSFFAGTSRDSVITTLPSGDR